MRSGSKSPSNTRSPILVLAVALIGISVAAPLIRISHDPPLTIAVWRLGFSLLLILPFLASSRGWRQWRLLGRHDFSIAIAAGVMLALHFWSWNASIFYTSVAASVVLVNTQPIIVALLSAIWLKEMPTPVQWAGITLAVAGACIVGWGDFSRSAGLASAGSHALLGDGLALFGGIAAAIYYVAGRRLRGTLDLWSYVALVYGVCFVTLLTIAVVTSTPLLPQPPRELTIFVGLAVGPMLLGHTGLNWALKYLPAYLVILTVLGEPIGATLLAAVLPGIRELPSASTFLGGIVLLAGVVIAGMARRSLQPRMLRGDQNANTAAQDLQL
jgi:drug/metabolite transporter (DMT)-like permease